MLNCPDKHKFKIKEFKKKYNNNIDFIEYANNEDAIRIQFESTILLKFNAFEQRKGHFGKLYEYAFSGKKVLAIDKKTGFNHKQIFLMTDHLSIISMLKNKSLLKFYHFIKNGKITNLY